MDGDRCADSLAIHPAFQSGARSATEPKSR